MFDMNESNTKIVAILCGMLCFTLTSEGNDYNYEQCYNIGRSRICYHTETKELRSWNESVQICDSMNSSLPFFQNLDEQITLVAYSRYLATNLTISDIWTCGQRHVFDNWTSVHGDIWNNYFPIQESSDGWQYGTHVMMTGKEELIAEKPSLFNLQMCQYSGDQCENSEATFLPDRSCFITTFFHDSWYEARNKCLLKGGDLLYISNPRVIDMLRNLAGLYGGRTDPYKFWIGLRKITWLWKLSFKEQQKEVTFTHWFSTTDYERISSRDLCIYINVFRFKWQTADCSEAKTVICQRREIIEPIVDASSTETTKQIDDASLSHSTETTKQIQSDWTNYITFGSVIGVAVVLCVTSITIAVLIVRRKTSVAGENSQDDKRYQGLKNAPTYSAPEIDDNYDTIDTDNGYYEDVDHLASEGNYESIAYVPHLELVDTEVSITDDPYLELVDTEVNVEEAGDDTEADRSSQLENVTEDNV